MTIRPFCCHPPNRSSHRPRRDDPDAYLCGDRSTASLFKRAARSVACFALPPSLQPSDTMPALCSAATAFIILATVNAATALAQSSDQPRTHAPRPTSAAISTEDARTRAYIIADDSMEGRDTGRRGGERSARYIAGELKRLGLEPAGDRRDLPATDPVGLAHAGYAPLCFASANRRCAGVPTISSSRRSASRSRWVGSRSAADSVATA